MTIARGKLTTVWGKLTIARGKLTTVWGKLTIARGKLTTAWGEMTIESVLGTDGPFPSSALVRVDRAAAKSTLPEAEVEAPTASARYAHAPVFHPFDGRVCG